MRHGTPFIIVQLAKEAQRQPRPLQASSTNPSHYHKPKHGLDLSPHLCSVHCSHTLMSCLHFSPTSCLIKLDISKAMILWRIFSSFPFIDFITCILGQVMSFSLCIMDAIRLFARWSHTYTHDTQDCYFGNCSISFQIDGLPFIYTLQTFNTLILYLAPPSRRLEHRASTLPSTNLVGAPTQHSDRFSTH